MYWIDEDTRYVMKVQKYKDSSRELLEANADDLSDIAIVNTVKSEGRAFLSHE